MKVFISPAPENSIDGINRVIQAYHDHLPQNGITVTLTPEDADIINIHGVPQVGWQGFPPNVPLVYTSHGLYWADVPGWPDPYRRYNQMMIDCARAADRIVAVSNWVAHSISRNLSRPVDVVHHGINVNEWSPAKNPTGYVLWAKGRADPVSDPGDMNRLADLMSGHPFVSTYGDEAPNVRIEGRLSREAYKRYLAHAGVYLSTARETFGIATLEALASGVPVVGWNWGGNSEIVQHGVTGYLAEPGDYRQLAEYVQLALERRQEMSPLCRENSELRWSWPDKVTRFAQILRETREQFHTPRPDVSVIVTCHNLGGYLTDCLESVRTQEGITWECIVVDDASVDNTAQIAQSFSDRDSRIRYLKPDKNLGLSLARNYGMSHSQGKYLISIDADDLLAAPNALSVLADGLTGNRQIDIAYGHLDIINENGEGRRRNDWPGTFNWASQMAHMNQLPYCGMMRRRVWENTGGYRFRHWRAEDAAFWCNVTAFGYLPHKVTESPTILYRIRGDSKSSKERAKGYTDGDWTRGYPWRVPNDGTAQGGYKSLMDGLAPSPNNVPYGAVGRLSGDRSWPVFPHDKPLVTVVIPVGKSHLPYVIDAVDSVISQTIPWRMTDIVVVNDSGEPLPWLPSWVTVLDTGGAGSIGKSRNWGVVAARSPLVVFLDADDMLLPTALQEMVTAYIENGGDKYVYIDWFSVHPEGVEAKSSEPYSQSNLRGKHPITILLEKSRIERDDLWFDETIDGWEDWDFFIRMAIKGYCGYHLPSKLLLYRTFSGSRREDSLSKADHLLPLLEERYGKYHKGEQRMEECCGGDDSGKVIMDLKKSYGYAGDDPGAIQFNVAQNTTRPSGKVRMEFIGKQVAPITFRRGLSRPYEGGDSAVHRYVNADSEEDARGLEASGYWRRVASPHQTDFTQAQLEAPVMTASYIPASMFAPADEGSSADDYDPAPPTTEQEGDDLGEFDPTSYSLAQLEIEIPRRKLTLLELQLALQVEMSSAKPRKGAIDIIETAIAICERVG